MSMENQAKGEKEEVRTQIKSIGRSEFLERLFEDTGYRNQELQLFDSSESIWTHASSLMLEGIDFDLVYTPLKHLGYKSALSVFGPLYAGGSSPAGLSCNIGLSARFAAEDAVLLWSGIVAAAREHSVKSLSLDLSSSITGLAIALSAQGEVKREVAAKFPKPAPNSLLCITGNMGAAYMGLHVLEREKAMFNKLSREQAEKYVQPDLSRYKYILSQYLSPEINPKMLEQFAQAELFPSAGVFINRGLARAVMQMCGKCGMGARIFLEKIPIASQTMEMAREINMDAVTAALNGGDDYKFLFAIPLSEHERFHREFPNMDVIGHLTDRQKTATLVTPQGEEIALKAL